MLTNFCLMLELIVAFLEAVRFGLGFFEFPLGIQIVANAQFCAGLDLKIFGMSEFFFILTDGLLQALFFYF